MVNTPIPHSLKSEAKKAAKILGEFTMPSARSGLDKAIPADLVFKAQGLAILTVAKIGFLVTARGGSGIVIARLPDGSWSAPSAIGIAGLGGGFEIGCEVTDFVIILNTEASVQAFSKGGNLTLGGNFTIAAGPLGRNLEGDIAVRSPAAIYTYSKTKGLFAGISIEGSALIERKDANRKFYCDDRVRSYDILGGKVDPPKACEDLYHVLDQHREMYLRMEEARAKAKEAKERARAEQQQYQSQHQYHSGGGSTSYSSKKTKMTRTQSARRNSAGSTPPRDEAYGSGNFDNMTSSEEDEPSPGKYKSKRTYQTASTTVVRRTQSMHAVRKTSATELKVAPPGELEKDEWNVTPKARALWPFSGQMPCDLAFEPGEEIEIMTRTDTQEDWWEGRLKGKVGIFPANFVEVLS